MDFLAVERMIAHAFQRFADKLNKAADIIEEKNDPRLSELASDLRMIAICAKHSKYPD